MGTLLKDLKYGARLMLKHRMASLVAVLTLALGLGATTSIFTITSELLLRPRPGIGNPSELVDIGRAQDGQGFDTFSYPDYRDLRDRNRSFSDVLAYKFEPRSVSLNTDGSAERLFGALVSGNYFSILQVKPALGRFFTQAEDKPGDPRRVMVLSHAFWKRRFAADPGILGRELQINRDAFTVIGVAPEEFSGNSMMAAEAWFPISNLPSIMPGGSFLNSRASCWVMAIGRLKPGVTLAQARADVSSITAQMLREHPREDEGRSFLVLPSRLLPGEALGYVMAFMAVLMGIVGLILLIVCINVAGILLVRATARRREVATRLALGASRARIVRQLLTEGVLLFLVGGGLGGLVAVWMCDFLVRMIPELPVPVSLTLHLDWRVMLFALGIAFVSGILSTLAPALQSTRFGIAVALKDEAQGGAHRLRLRNALVLGQVALSLLLLACGGLFLRALARARTLDPGFSVENLQVTELDFSLAGYGEQDGTLAAERLMERVRALPGVQGASMAWSLPLDGSGHGLGGIERPGGAEGFIEIDWNVITPGYLSAMRIPILRGRDITEADDRAAPGVVIVNETLARRFWPSQDPVGRQVRVGEPSADGSDAGIRTLTVIGVARNHLYRSLGDDARSFIYVPLRQNYVRNLNLIVRTTAGGTVFPGIRAAVREINPGLPVLHMQSLKEYTGIGLLPQRIAAWLSGCLGAVGLFLTGLGLYGITAFSVGQRTREVGIRVALGASRRDILGLILRSGAKLAVAGMLVGLALSLAAAKLIAGLLVGVNPWDPLTFAAVAVLMGGVLLVASYIPAWRAARVDPTVALRYEG
jgi:predicted permease